MKKPLKRPNSSSAGDPKILLQLPQWMLDGIDKEADKLGIARLALIKTCLGAFLNEIQEREIRFKSGK
jgi:hypothetical protein